MTEQAAQKGRKVLILDDSEVQLHFEERVLARAGFEVRTASSLAAFDQILKSWSPDIVLTDVQMPDIRGDQLCRMLKLRLPTSRTPVVLFSSWPDDDVAATAPRCSADGYLSKPTGLGRLAEEPTALGESLLW